MLIELLKKSMLRVFGKDAKLGKEVEKMAEANLSKAEAYANEMETERNEMAENLSKAEAERNEVVAERDELQRQLSAMQAQIAALTAKQKG